MLVGVFFVFRLKQYTCLDREDAGWCGDQRRRSSSFRDRGSVFGVFNQAQPMTRRSRCRTTLLSSASSFDPEDDAFDELLWGEVLDRFSESDCDLGLSASECLSQLFWTHAFHTRRPLVSCDGAM